MENGVLKTYTFLYSEDFSCEEKNYGNVVETIDNFKVRFVIEFLRQFY